MSKPTGLQGSIGTATHMISFWTRNSVDAWLAGFYARESATQGAKAARTCLALAETPEPHPARRGQTVMPALTTDNGRLFAR